MNRSVIMRLLSLFLAIVMVVGFVPATVYATNGNTEPEVPETEEIIEETADEGTVTYTVNHSILDFEADIFVLKESEEMTGTAGELTAAQEKDYEGCILFEEIQQVEIAADGSTVVDVYYIELQEEAVTYVNSTRYNTSVSSDYFKVISEKEYDLAPGATEIELVLNNASGSDRKVTHVIEVDPNETTIQVLPGYYQIDKLDADNLSDSTYWSTAGLTSTVAYYEDVLGYNVVGAMNTALSYDSNAPYGFMVYNGVVLGTPDVHSGAQTYLAVTKNADGTVKFELRNMSEALHGDEWQALPANFGWLVQDGKMTATNVNRDDSDASRSMLGIKADGTLVICQVDGRNAPTSTGLSNYEMGEMMLALGCVWAINGDGGGSSTFITKREGTTENIMRSKPSDGYERPTINSIIVVSTAVADGTFDHAFIDTDVEYVTPGSTVTFTSRGVDAGGGSAEIPSDITWQLADASMGTVENGVFTSNGTVGTAVVQMVYGNEVVGECSVEVTNPTAISFTQANYVVPYGKYIDFAVKATINDGQIEITQKDSDFTFEISNTDVGTINGKRFTAVDTAGEVTTATVTATYTCGDVTLTATAPLSLGKGSEIIESYESYEVGARIYDYINAHGYGAGDSYVEVVDATTGKVRNGEKALAIHVDGTEYRYYGTFSQNRISDIDKDGIGANGDRPIAMGAWVYIPEEATGLYLGIRGRKPGTTTTAFTLYLTPNQEYTGTLERPGWYYLSVDMTAINYEFDLYSFELFMYEQDGGYHNEVDLSTEQNLLGKYTIYIDDITLDYSSAVEDREIPEFDDIYIASGDAGVVMNGQTVTSGTIGAYVQAYDHVADNAVGLDISTAKAYVDGIQVTNGFNCTANGMLSLSGVSLSAGAHTFRFEIADANGNVAEIQRHVVVAGTAPISIVPQSTDANDILVGSTYWIDVKAANIEDIQKVTTVLELDGIHDWILDHIEVADGFEAVCSLDQITNDVMLVITRVGSVSATGEGVLVSIPIHVWEYEQWYNGKTAVEPGAVDWEVQNNWKRAVKLCADYGVVTYTSGSGATFAMAPLTAAVESDPTWHIHVPQAVEDKEPTCTEAGYTGRTVCVGCQCGAETHGNGAACPADGCGAAIIWGTTIPATGHTYVLTEGVLQCECGATFTGVWEEDGKEYVDGVVISDGWMGDCYYANGAKVTGIYAVEDVYYDFGEDGINQGEVNGLFALNDKVYCAIAGQLVTGWQMVEDGWCYASTSTKEVQVGEFTVSGMTYTANENGVVVKGAWVTDAKGTKYSYGPAFHTREWVEIEGAKYYFGTDSYVYTGLRFIVVNRNNVKEGYRVYKFADDGKLEDEMLDANGIIASAVDGIFYVENGTSVYGGLMLIDGDYYYARTSGQLVVGKTYWITKSNDLLPVAYYNFDENGKLIDPPVVEEPEPDQPEQPEVPAVKNGIISEDGKLWWYVDGVKTYAGLMLIDGDYYYARSSGEILTNCKYWITKNNDLLPVDYYNFDENGKMIDAPVVEEPDPEPEQPDQPEQPEVPAVKNGIISEDGKLWWYVDGVKTYGGLMYLDTDGDGEADTYYYARTSGQLVVSKKYWITKNNDLLPEGYYNFDENGKMIDAPVA